MPKKLNPEITGRSFSLPFSENGKFSTGKQGTEDYQVHEFRVTWNSFDEMIDDAKRQVIIKCGDVAREDGFPVGRVVEIDHNGKFVPTPEDKAKHAKATLTAEQLEIHKARLLAELNALSDGVEDAAELKPTLTPAVNPTNPPKPHKR